MKNTLRILVVLLISFSIVGCSSNKAEHVNKLNIGALSSIDAIPLIIAQDKGFFKANDLDVDIKLFKEVAQRDSALKAGELDALITDNITLAMYINSGLDLKVTNLSTGKFSIIVNKDSGINKVSDLKNKKIGTENNSTVNFITDRIVSENKIKSGEIEKVVIPSIPLGIEALNNKKIDAVILPAPFESLSENTNHKIIETLSNDELELTSLVFNNTLLVKDKTLIKRFIKAYNQAVDYINNTDVKNYEDLIVKVIGVSKENLKHIKLPYYRYATLPSLSSLQNSFDWAYANNLVDKKINAVDIIAGE